jgi:hypothetical protein
MLNILLVNVFAQDNNETVSSTTRNGETTITNVFLSFFYPSNNKNIF